MKTWIVTCLAVFAIACGGDGGGNNDQTGGDGGNGDGMGGGDGGNGDAFSGECMPGAAQCANCIDDDGDGDIDGYDIQCTGPLDNDESSFATGIPGDNIDAVKQDCFFDGNSGSGNDGCDIHVCCLLGATTVQECPFNSGPTYNPMACPPPIGTGTITQQCKDVCGKLTPPGCDCFGCCTLCDPTTNDCFDIATNPNTSPNCTTANLSDPAACLRCTKVSDCGNTTCGGTSCILCPGQDPSDLPAECNMQECPGGGPTCGLEGVCPEGLYCSNGCCIGTIL